MLRISAAVGLCILGLGDGALAADPPAIIAPDATTWKQSLVLDGSLGALATDNALATRWGRIDAGYVVPYLRLTYGLTSTDGWSFTAYARNTTESYTRGVADNVLSTVGTTLSKTTGELTIGTNFDTKFFFDGFFANQTLIAYDWTGFLTNDHTFEEVGLRVVPRFTVGYRWAEIATAERVFIDAQLSLEKYLNPSWSILATGRFRTFWFQAAAIGPKPIDYYPSGSVGIKYDFRNGVTVTTSLAFLARRSNIIARNYEKLDVGPSIDFKYPLPIF